jgi:hypothetical protein
MTAQTYAQIQAICGQALTRQAGPAITSFDALFTAEFPSAISYAENRIYREMPALAERASNASVSTANGVRTISFASLNPPLLVPEQLNLIVAGSRIQFYRTSLDFLNAYWPVTATVVTPSLTSQYGRYFTMQDAYTAIIAPTPDATYTAEIVGLFLPASLSATNTTTYLSNVYPELLTAGILVFLTGALTRNFGSQADEPQSAQSWEHQFQELLEAAKDEERRRRGLLPDFPTIPPPPQQGASA